MQSGSSKSHLLIASLFAFGLSSAAAATDYSYNLTLTGDLPGGSVYSTALGLSDSGQVVGQSNAEAGYRGFSWNGGAPLNLGDLPDGDDWSNARSINSAGVIVGGSADSTASRPVVWKDGIMTVLPELGGNGAGEAYGINEAGQIVGWSTTNSGSHATMWENGIAIDLGDLPGGSSTGRASAINDSGQVVGRSSSSTGTHAFLWENGAMTDLGDLPGGSSYSEANDINNSGQIVGWSKTATKDHATLWENGNMVDLMAGSTDGFLSSKAYGINDAGFVVGTGLNDGGSRAFIWDSVMGMQNLNDMFSPVDDFILASALGINSSGQIVGWGYSNQLGITSGFLLTPIGNNPVGGIPEPATWLMMMLGFGFTAVASRRRIQMPRAS